MLESFLDRTVSYRCGVCDRPISSDSTTGVRMFLRHKDGGISGVIVYLCCSTHSEQEIIDAFYESKSYPPTDEGIKSTLGEDAQIRASWNC